ncbi:pilus assembly protein FimV [Pseudomonas fluvialis]|uniref:Pilus assembly protein FimV n=2 Tax=Pseudomonas fluvialis TaxID=1793966 RepID=A0A7X0BSD7_9PSED|nr:pilus assembly protein FimV [Pseudomonas fluvialis]
MAHALGLGEINLKSALNQPLSAEIALMEVRDLASGEVVSTLASPEEFSKAGVDRQYFLTDLKFTPVIKPNGQSVIRVTSSKPVREPYLNFLVEVAWPTGRTLREYTILLDPPLYSPQAAAAPQMPVAAPVTRPQVPVAAAPVSKPTYSAPAPRPAAAPVATSRIEGNQYKTTGNDTLWEIAARVRPNSSVSVHQTMLAIQDLNPDAFLAGNINRLKNNQVLRLPDEQQIKARSQAEAIAQVAEQNTAWREGRAVAAAPAGTRQLDATKRASAGAAPAKVERQDSLKLVAADSGKAAGGSEKGAAEAKALNDKLAVTKESLDSTRSENAELKDRMGDLQSQLDKLQKLVALKDAQMAKLQADLAAKDKVAAAPAAPVKPAAPAVAEPAKAEASKPVAAAPAASKPAETKPVQVKPVEAAPAAAKPAQADFNYAEEPAKPAAPVAKPAAVPAAKPAEAAKPVAPVKPAVQPAKPVVAPAPAEPVSFIDELMANPLLLGAAGGGALLLLLVGLMVLSRRNAMKETELQSTLAGRTEESLEADLDMPESSFEGLSEEPQSALAEAEEERVTPQTGDPLAEADIYIAYGKFSQAADLLHNAINQEPQRSDLRLKLMEVLAEMGDREGYQRQAGELAEMGGAQSQVEQLNAKYPAMVAAAAVAAASASALDDLGDFNLDDLTLDDPISEPVKASASDLDDAFDLSLDDLEGDLAADLPNTSDAGSVPELSLDDDFSFDLPAEPASAPVALAEDDLGFDLEMSDEPLLSATSSEQSDDLADFSLELEADLPAAAAEEEFTLSLEEDGPAALSDDLADFSLDEPLAAPAAVAGEERDLPMDFDLSLADEPLAAPAAEADDFAAQLEQVSAELDQMAETLSEPAPLEPAAAPVVAPLADALEGEEDFDFLSGTDETATKLDLARAYIDMGDSEGARDILDEVLAEGNDAQQVEARELIAKLV